MLLFAPQLIVREPSQLTVDDRNQLVERRLASLPPREQQSRDVVLGWRRSRRVAIVQVHDPWPGSRPVLSRRLPACADAFRITC